MELLEAGGKESLYMGKSRFIEAKITRPQFHSYSEDMYFGEQEREKQ